MHVDKGINEKLILNNIRLVEKRAKKYYISDSSIDYDDIVSIGIIGLVNAIKKYDSSRVAKFDTYASVVISSQIIDELRRITPVSRKNVKLIKEYKESSIKLQNTLLREPSKYEIAKEMGLSVEIIESIEVNKNNLTSIYLDKPVEQSEMECKLVDILVDENSSCLEEWVIFKEEVKELKKKLNLLDRRSKLIIMSYYYEEKTLKAIGKELGLSESRIYQMKKKILKDLKFMLSKRV